MFAETKLTQLSPADVQSWVDGLINAGVASRMRQVAFVVLRKAVRHARKLGNVDIDATAEIGKPSHEAEEIFPFSAAEAERIIAATVHHRWHVAVMLGLTAGLRIGEVLGMPWDAVDIPGRQIRVYQQAAETRGRITIRRPKTKGSVRTIDMPETLANAILAHRAIMLKEGNLANPLLCCGRRGKVTSRTNFANRFWKPLLRHLGIQERGFHHCRHTYATLALNAGVPIHVVSQVLGHRRPSTTHNVYSHVLEGQQSRSAAAMDTLFADAAKSLPNAATIRRKSSGG